MNDKSMFSIVCRKNTCIFRPLRAVGDAVAPKTRRLWPWRLVS
jgi:hypothetical protein